MKFKMFTNTLGKCLRVVCVGVLASLAVACSDDENASATAPFDPSQPVTISYFTPESGGYQDQILIYGSNFGTNKEALELEIGGKKAVIVSCMSDKLYAYVPAGAFDGTVTLSVIDGEGNKHTATAPTKFMYNRKTVVGTLCGYKNANDDQGVTWGPFSTITGFNHEGTLAFDPVYPNRLYITYDFGEGYIAELDLDARVGKRLISASRFGTKRLRNIAFTKAVEGSKYLTKDGDYMLVSTDRDDNQFKSTSVWIVKRGGDGTFSDSNPTNILAAYKQCNGVAVATVWQCTPSTAKYTSTPTPTASFSVWIWRSTSSCRIPPTFQSIPMPQPGPATRTTAASRSSSRSWTPRMSSPSPSILRATTLT